MKCTNFGRSSVSKLVTTTLSACGFGKMKQVQFNLYSFFSVNLLEKILLRHGTDVVIKIIPHKYSWHEITQCLFLNIKYNVTILGRVAGTLPKYI